MHSITLTYFKMKDIVTNVQNVREKFKFSFKIMMMQYQSNIDTLLTLLINGSNSLVDILIVRVLIL